MIGALGFMCGWLAARLFTRYQLRKLGPKPSRVEVFTGQHWELQGGARVVVASSTVNGWWVRGPGIYEIISAAKLNRIGRLLEGYEVRAIKDGKRPRQDRRR